MRPVFNKKRICCQLKEDFEKKHRNQVTKKVIRFKRDEMLKSKPTARFSKEFKRELTRKQLELLSRNTSSLMTEFDS